MNKEKTNSNKIVNVKWLANLHLNKIRKRGICVQFSGVSVFGSSFSGVFVFATTKWHLLQS